MKTALFIPALVSLGPYGAGAVQALVKDGSLEFDVIAASSGGVIAGAFAATGQIDRLVAIWRTWENEEIAAMDWGALLRGGLFWAPSLMSNEPQYRTGIEPYLSADRLLPGVRFRFHMMNLSRGREEIVEYPGAAMPLPTAVRAAVAVPALFPPVNYDGMQLADGAVLNPAPLARLLQGTGIERLFVVGLAPQLPAREPVTNAPARLQAALEWNQYNDLFSALEEAAERNQMLQTWAAERQAVEETIAELIADPDLRGRLLAKVAHLYGQGPLPGWPAPMEIIPILPRQKLAGLFGDFDPERSRRLLALGREDALRVLEALV